jgi:ribosomal protein L11 methyltransferase
MIVWQKQASEKWLEAHETELARIAGTNLAIITRPGRVRSLVQIFCPNRKLATHLQGTFGGKVDTSSAKSFPLSSAHPPIRVGPRLEVMSAATGARLATSQLVIPAAGAFGTGEHVTTAMSLRLLEEVSREFPPGWRLLDAGTGSGILALAARRLGAAEAIGVDNDPRAIAIARQNARQNRIGRVQFVDADILQLKCATRCEVVTANLFSELLIAALPTFQRALRKNGKLIVSGILREQAAGVIAALSQSGFCLEKKRRRGKWVALLCVRPHNANCANAAASGRPRKAS